MRVTNALRAEGLPFALAGGCAIYAHGGPASDHDVDVFITEQNASAARAALVAAGMRAADPPEDWLIKVYDDDCLVDLIFRPNQRPVTGELLDRAVEKSIGATTAPVLPATDLIIDKLLVLNEQRCDFTDLLLIARALREQVDWIRVRQETDASPYAHAFLTLLADLDVLNPGLVAMVEGVAYAALE